MEKNRSNHKFPRSIGLHHTAERSFPSWKGPSGVGCKANLSALVKIHWQNGHRGKQEEGV